MKTRMILVISDMVFFRNRTWTEGLEFMKEHPGGKINRHPGRVIMTCTDFTNKVLDSWDRCDVDVAYYRIVSSDALRGIYGKVEIVWQPDFKPRRFEEFSERLMAVSRSG